MINIFILNNIINGEITCSQSYECGNVPYSICKNKFDLYDGIGVDPEQGKVFVIGKFNSSGVSYGNVTIASVPMNGVGILKTEFTIKSDVTQGSSFRNTFQLFKYLPKSKTFLTQAGERLSMVIGIYDDKSKINLTPLWYPRGYQLGAHFDEVNQLTYTCDFDFKIFPKIVKTQDDLFGSNSSSSKILKNTTQCFAISNAYTHSIFNNTIIFVQNKVNEIGLKFSTFLMGSADCVMCSREFYNLYQLNNEWVTGFHIYNNRIYYSSKNGITQMNVPGTDQRLKLTNESVESFEFVNNEKTIYYITTNGKIMKINIETLASSLLYDSFSDKSLGICECAPGFTGTSCNQCTNGTVQWDNGNPTCVKRTEYGRPSKCQVDWQCGNSPYFLCVNNECLCRSEFFGDKCDQCQGKITWENGIPICGILHK
ncbi:hypothetical protein RB653_007675 [Dictyostelium firmibasis]|uniref:Laminin EGF-like domain-containing protein n=1 Tax=Dictyostelium firmibasis TaxID=79012 RepID=A0AAN7YRN4_9MYCE